MSRRSEVSQSTSSHPTMVEPSNSNRITVNAAEQDSEIRSVTVFQANRAEIKRRVKLNLRQGQNHVDIERLPSCINEDSIRVEGTGTAVIFDVVYRRQKSSEIVSIPDPSDDDATTLLHRELFSLKKERDIVKAQFQFLNSYGSTLNSQSVDSAEVAQFLDMFGPRQVEVAKRLQELDIKIAQVDKDYKAQVAASGDAYDAKRNTKITVTVLAKDDGKAELLLTYVVSHASWTPLYDVRATIGQASTPSSIGIHYRASITQTTGENWPEVPLTLSTASPQQSSSMPSLSPWRIGCPQPRHRSSWSPPRSRRSRSRSHSPPRLVEVVRSRSRRQLSRSRSRSPDYFRRRSRSPTRIITVKADEYSAPVQARPRSPSPIRWRNVENVSSNTLSATFRIPGRSSIPSDEDSHKVVIQVLNLQTNIEWVCIPRRLECVFLKCNVLNTSEFTLLPGAASVFLNNTFVSKTTIEHVMPNDSFEISLGADAALRVTYPAMRTLNSSTQPSVFTFRNKATKQNITTYSQRITIRNSRSTSVPALRVIDHVPISTDEVVKVNVLAPAGLGPAVLPVSEVPEEASIKEREWTRAQKRVKARWAPLDVGGEGTVEWSCDMKAGEEIELELSWEVSVPVGQKWVTK
ncbi:hypothetical protein BDV93DRAFT_465221 [Ceratobasidium sp. AG-I]|nr:hypothetical protein BDV93DRAFT_465221 [Ceratobasidium sp. AG-I]